ncbi:gamma-glutamyltransferase [Acuticoccus sp. I52.16.1]|uniref:gamma-glutamyltransferase n=1 Tax=Acuticoccus sp. I52.16.1 TaxID=2928472 RepID=UPI001FD5F5F5|nr:gamma-glutamyltransferase [Acuticoccus sp. I52.16.1]UOM37165.1 gamma-glutamyltransferase family protein [Acuticoccus sp. I52.16.1]
MQTWTIERHEVSSEHGLVAAQNMEAAAAGAKVLAAGGNAMDAAIVTALVLGTVEPWLSGIGGGGFLLHADGATGAVDTLDFNVRAFAALDPADYPLTGGMDGEWFAWPAVKDDRNISGYTSICLPGAIDGFAEALARYGTLSWGDALEPAIAFAARGMAVDWFASLCLAIDAPGLRAFPASAALFLPGGGPPIAKGATEARYLPMPGKAALLRRLQARGARDFYEGESAAILVDDLVEGGAAATAGDLAAYRAAWRPPLTTHYRGRELALIPGLSGGPSLARAFALLEKGWTPKAAPDAEAALAYADAVRGSYRERLNTMGHAAEGDDCTSHVSVVDKAGNMVALTNTILSRFGSKVVLPRSGILMNNGMMWFDPRPGMPNSIAPGARPLANMSPAIMLQDGRPALAIGAAGGRTIFPTVAQILSYVVDYGMTLEAAFQTPRIDASTPTIKVNRAAAPDVAAKVATRFPVEIVDDTLYPTNFAIPSAVGRDLATGRNTGMGHHSSPWAGVAVGAPADG